MGYIDKIWEKITELQINDIDQKVHIAMTTDFYNNVIREYKLLNNGDLYFIKEEEQVSKRDLQDFFASTISITSNYIDDGFRVDAEI